MVLTDFLILLLVVLVMFLAYFFYQEQKKRTEILKKEFQILSAEALSQQLHNLSELSQKSLSTVLQPFKTDILNVQKAMQDRYDKQKEDIFTLKGEITSSIRLGNELKQETANLTRALKGDMKSQGLWGELTLKKLLENSGLKEGLEYSYNKSLGSTSDVASLRPDVVIHLPSQRQVVIDAKVSLKSYLDFLNAESQEKKKQAEKDLLQSIKSHIKNLSDKSYAQGVSDSLDFVFLFFPIESALSLVWDLDSQLFDTALNKHSVHLLGPNTLMSTLKLINFLWKKDKQEKNVSEIMKLTIRMQDHFFQFLESFDQVGKQLDTVRKTYDKSQDKLKDSRVSLAQDFEKLKDYGISGQRASTSKH